MARLDRLVDIVVLVNREQLLCSIAYFTLEIGEQSPLQAEAEALNPPVDAHHQFILFRTAASSCTRSRFSPVLLLRSDLLLSLSHDMTV